MSRFIRRSAMALPVLLIAPVTAVPWRFPRRPPPGRRPVVAALADADAPSTVKHIEPVITAALASPRIPSS